MSAQCENGYTRIANELVEALCHFRIPGEQMQCLLFIIRKTYGYGKIDDCIANSQFCEATGMKKGNVSRAVKELTKKQLVIKNDNGRIPSYRFNKDYTKWKLLSKLQPVINTATGVIKTDNKVLSKVMDTKERKKILQKKEPRKKYGTFNNVLLTDSEHSKLLVRFNSSCQDKIDALSEGIKSKGYKYKDYYATILAWDRKDNKNGSPKKKTDKYGFEI